MPIFGCTVYEGAAVQVHQNVRAAGNFWLAGRFSDRAAGNFRPAAFLTGTGKNAYFWTFA